MKKTLLSILMLLCILSVQAVKKVAYITLQKTMDATATIVTNDPIIQVLKADPNFDVTVKAITTTEIIDDLATYDVIIVQESNGGGDATLKPTGSLALKSIPKPFIYNKAYALKSTRALTTSTALGGKETALSLSITVAPTALTNDLFKSCTISGSGEISIFNAPTTDAGLIGAATSIKAINYSSGNVISGESTILANPTILNADNSPVAICINDIPAGATIDSETLFSRMIALSMNFGAISADAGKNITNDGLTIWRNAVYILAGLTVPSSKATLPTGINQAKQLSDITFDGKLVRNAKNLALSVYNITGKLVSTSDKDIDMSNFTTGIYFVKSQNNTLKVNLLK